MIAAVVLAAGASTRLGEPKQLVMLRGETLLQRAVRTAREAGASPVLVVLGAAYEEIVARADLEDAHVVLNPRWQEGMSTSICVGLQSLVSGPSQAEGVLLMTCDQPAVTPAHLQLLMSGPESMASRYASRNGVPAYFPRRHFEALMNLAGDAGARSLLSLAEAVDLAHGDLDIDTPEDLARALELFG